MFEIQKKGYFPFKQEFVDTQVPPQAGILIVAVQEADGSYQPFYTEETANLQHHLRKFLLASRTDLPPLLSKHLRNDECYFTYYVIVRGGMRTVSRTGRASCEAKGG